MQCLYKLFYGNYMLFRYFFSSAKTLINLPVAIYHRGTLNSLMKENKEFKIRCDKKIYEKYKNETEKISEKIKEIEGENMADFTLNMIIFYLLRVVIMIAASTQSASYVFLLNTMQFLLLPYSLFVSFTYFFATSIFIFLGNMLSFPLLTYTVNQIVPQQYNLKLEITNYFIVIFFIIDQLGCLYCTFNTRRGKTKKVELKRIFQSFIYGFFNTKTYNITLLLLLRGHSIPLIAWLIDAISGLSTYISNKAYLYRNIFFYHQHKSAHIPVVYHEAHKFHHYLHDTTPFDAHIFGSGSPEEYFMFAIEALPALFFNFMPPSLSFHVLDFSWENKWGFHTRKEKMDNHFDNFHADHHYFHTKNYSLECPIDVLMKTAANNDYNELPGYCIQRVDSDDYIDLVFTPINEQKIR